MSPLRTIADRFELERLAAQGGMGTVYRAFDRARGMPVAVKLIREFRGQAVERFQREARVLSGLRHDAIVGYVGHGTTAEGESWLAMDWLEGEDLQAWLRRGPLALSEAVALTRRVADALALAHVRGVVHRDVKPSNLFLVGGLLERAMVLDFGIAQLGDTLTGTGRGGALGTPGYMAPEQARGEGALEPSADVFALGCVLFECLVGRPVFLAEHAMALLAKILFEEAPRTRALRGDVPPELDELIARMLSKTPGERPRDGAAVVAALDGLVASTGGAETVPYAPALSSGELRVVSVVVAAGRREADADTPTLDPADAARPRREVARAVEPFGARVEQLADGSFVAVVRSRGSATDQAAFAARCALAMRAVLPLAPMVLATGRAFVSQRVPLGEVIDRAVSIVRRARDTDVSIRLDDVTAGLLDARFEVGGDEGGLALLGARDRGVLARTLLGRPTPLVGRDRELATLRALAAESSEDSAARVALVTGAPGSGKSRLLQELLVTLDDPRRAVELWIARGDPVSAGSPFAMLAQLTRRAARIHDGEPLAVRQQKLRARVSLHARPEEAPRIGEFLGELIGAPFEGAASEQLRAARQDAVLMGDQMRRAWEDLAAGVCAEHPLLVVLEDLHWGDLPTVKCIEGALRFLRDAPLTVVAFARPEVHELFPRLWSERGLQELRLGELSRRACERLARHALGDSADDARIAHVVERCDGNAFYLEELIRAVAEGRGERLPDTVLAMVQSRLEGLPAEARQVLRAASVFGGTCFRGGLEALLGGPRRRREIDALVADLCERELLTRSAVARFPGEVELAFRHALLRDAAYAMLTEGDRRLGHALAGDWLERAGEQDAVVLAEHFERGGDHARAKGRWRAAAAAALEGNDFDGAIARGERGVACGAEQEELGEIRAIQALAHAMHGRPREAKEQALAAMALLSPESDAWWLAARRYANALIRLGEGDALPALADRLGEAVGERASGVAVAGLAVVAECLCFAGRYELADALFARIERVRPAVVEPADEAFLHVARAIRASIAGIPSEALARRLAAVAAFDRAGRLRTSCHEKANVGAVLNELGAYEEAERSLRAALHDAERMDLRIARLVALNNLGWSTARLGKLDEALAYESEAVAASIAQGDRLFESGSRTLLARILLLRGDPEAALGEARSGLCLAEASLPQRPSARAALAEVLLRLDRLDEADVEAGSALAELESLGGVEEGESLVRLLRVETLAAKGDEPAAREALAAALASLRRRASAIDEPTRRASFLSAVDEHARITSLARRWGVGELA